ncbi:MAG: RNA-directed DNA polymerase [Sandaracinaceae bacterium]|nr:RNA-directed DNA polymerase [Sandaracinaceae bacterium]
MSDDKAKLYKLITSQLSEHQVLWRMRELGFWPEGQPIPDEPLDAQEERAKLTKELEQLRKQGAKIANPEKALAQERIRRWQESKKRRAIAKAERAASAKERSEKWKAHKAVALVHAGEEHSAGLQDRESDAAKLASRSLPVLHDAPDLAKAMGIELSALRWLTYHRRAAALVHYHRYTIPKKAGGTRAISAPKPALAKAQEWVLGAILDRLVPEPEAHGFVAEHSVLTNAAPHAKKKIVVNLDLRDFFPSLGFRRVKGLFRKLGYSEHIATLLSLLCTEPPRVEAELDGKVWHVALGERVLPQGACTSPAITNAVCRRLDRRLRGLAGRHGFAYTRYADDLTFSGDDRKKVARLLKSVRAILQSEGFVEHPRKTRVMGSGSRQEVTGLTVNAGVKLGRGDKRRLRAILHNAAKHGLASQNRRDHRDFAAHLAGLVSYASMVEPERAADWKARLDRALSSS